MANARRRFMAAVSYGVALLSGSATARDLPKCETGDVVRNGWRGHWTARKIEVTSNRPGPAAQHVPDAKFFGESNRARGAPLSATRMLGLKLTAGDDKRPPVLWIDATPVYFETEAARYDAHYKIDYSTTGIHRTPITDGISGIADVRVTLRRKGVPGLYTRASENGATFTVSGDRIQKLLEDGQEPLIVEFSADGRRLMARAHDVNGMLQVLAEARPGLERQGARAKAKICDPGCYLTTAVCGAVGLDDACWELRSLRRFRDGPLAATAHGGRLIAEYYRDAPALVERIGELRDARSVYLAMYWRFIVPSALLASAGQNRLAERLYASLVAWVRAKVA